MKIDAAAAFNIDYWRTWIFLALMFIGLSLAALGAEHLELFLLASGAVFDVLISFALRTTLPRWGLVTTWLGMIVGSATGVGLGLVLGSTTAWVAGFVEAAFIGAFLGMMVVAAIFHSLGIPVFPGIKVVLIPHRLISIVLPLGALIGGILGAVVWRENVTQVFGAIGGGMVALGGLGMATGLFLGYRASARTGT